MSYNCNIFVKGSTKTSISNVTDALSHYRGKSGKTVPAHENLINEMKNDKTYKKMINELKETIKNKITQNSINNRETISAASGSRRGLRCGCLGSYSVDINYSFVPKNGENNVNIHFSGYDTWDFEWNENAGFLRLQFVEFFCDINGSRLVVHFMWIVLLRQKSKIPYRPVVMGITRRLSLQTNCGESVDKSKTLCHQFQSNFWFCSFWAVCSSRQEGLFLGENTTAFQCSFFDKGRQRNLYCFARVNICHAATPVNLVYKEAVIMFLPSCRIQSKEFCKHFLCVSFGTESFLPDDTRVGSSEDESLFSLLFIRTFLHSTCWEHFFPVFGHIILLLSLLLTLWQRIVLLVPGSLCILVLVGACRILVRMVSYRADSGV